jgi:hypothetical protein
MAKPKAFDSLTPEQQDAWRVKEREYQRKRRAANPEKLAETERKWRTANTEKVAEQKRKYHAAARQQAAADQFFVMAGAAQQISETIGKPKQKTT